MCFGQFSVTDPRCGAFSLMADGHNECWWCQYVMTEKAWFQTQEMLQHEDNCPMLRMGKELLNGKT